MTIKKLTPFQDVKVDQWYYHAINKIYYRGFMKGINQNTFSPNSNMTRAMVANVLYNMEKIQM